MPRTITALNSLLETRRLLRSIRLITEKHRRELNKINPFLPTKRILNTSNNNVRILVEKIYKDSRQNIKLLGHASIILKTHLYDTAKLNRKMYQQSIDLLEQNQELEKIAESVMEAYIASTKPDTPLNTITKDLVRKFSKVLTVTSKTISKNEMPYSIITLRSSNSIVVYCIIYSDKNGHRYKTFLNEIPVDITDKNFNAFVSPSQAYKEIIDVLSQDGIV